MLIAKRCNNLITLGWIYLSWSGLTLFIKVKRSEAPPLIKLNEFVFFTSNIYERGVKIFLRSYLFGSFFTILDKQIRAFFLTALVVLFESAKSKTASAIVVNELGIIVASIERAKDWAA